MRHSTSDMACRLDGSNGAAKPDRGRPSMRWESPARALLFLGAWFTALAQGTSADEGRAKPLMARQILDRMSKVYAACKSYQDSGVVKTVFIQPGANRTVEKPFATAFVRPDRFRFEYKEKRANGQDSRYIVWRKGKDVQTWWDITPGIKKRESLGLAVAGATGVSGSSAHTIPALRVPGEVGGRRLTEIAEPSRAEDDKLAGVACFRIVGRFAGDPMTLWIDQRTLLVRRIETQHQFANFRTVTTTTYDPTIDADVHEKRLAFDPPMKK
jgi:outer membrane lipoprotein-sorting protein